MRNKCVLFALWLWLACGVFGDTGEVKTVSVMEGDSVTLNTYVTEIKTEIQITWTFQATRIAEIYIRDHVYLMFVSKDEIFKDHLQMNNQTGSVTVRNIRSEHSGLYKLTISRDKVSYMSFSVNAYAHLPVPVISRDTSQCSSSSERSSSSTCVLLCSVVNVTHVTLSWYKGNSLFSSISASDLNIRLSLPLEVEYQDTNTYSCVLNNPIRNQTQHLHITDVCGSCSKLQRSRLIPVIAVAIIMLMLIIVAPGVIYCHCKNCKQPATKVQSEEEIYYAEPICARRFQDTDVVEADHTEYSSVRILIQK